MLSKLLCLTTHAPPVQYAIYEIQNHIAQIKSKSLLPIVEQILTNIIPYNILQNNNFANLFQIKYIETVGLKNLPNSFIHNAILIAPGSCHAHHTYPGGLIVHTALNLRAIKRLQKAFRISKKEYDTLVAAHVIHDLLKAGLLPWRRGGTPVVEPRLFGTGAHHILILACLLLLEAPDALLKAVASIHAHPYNEPDKVKRFLIAGACLAGLSGTAIKSLVRKIAPTTRLDMLAYLGEKLWWEYSVAAERVARNFMHRAAENGELGEDWPPVDRPSHRWAQNYVLTMLTEINFIQYFKRSEKKAIQRIHQVKKDLYALKLWPIDDNNYLDLQT